MTAFHTEREILSLGVSSPAGACPMDQVLGRRPYVRRWTGSPKAMLENWFVKRVPLATPEKQQRSSDQRAHEMWPVALVEVWNPPLASLPWTCIYFPDESVSRAVLKGPQVRLGTGECGPDLRKHMQKKASVQKTDRFCWTQMLVHGTNDSSKV